MTVDDADEAAICEVAADVAQILTNFDVAQELLTRALEVHRARGDREAAARVTATLGQVILNARRLGDGFKVLSDGVREFADLAESRSLLKMKSQQARYYMLNNEFPAVLPLTDEVLLAAEHNDDLELLTDTLVTRGTALLNLSRWREADAVLAAAIEIAKANGHNATWLRAINNSLIGSLLAGSAWGAGVDPRWAGPRPTARA